MCSNHQNFSATLTISLLPSTSSPWEPTHCRPHPHHPGKGNILGDACSSVPRRGSSGAPPRGPVAYSNSGWPRAQTTQSICSSVLMYCTPSWWEMNASRSLNSPSHVHVPCAHAEAQEKLQHAKAGFSEPNPGWFQTSAWVNVRVQRGVCKTAGKPTQ